MSKSFKVDLTGQRFGRLKVLEFVPNDRRKAYWKCQCDCGNITTIIGRDLRRGHTLSCGCFQIEQAVKCNTKHNSKHTRIYSIWCGMKQRCLNSNNESYKDYGGRGITICEEWLNDFKVFYDWALQNGYTDELTIDRIDVNGNYEPNNCRWTDMKTQQRNKSSNVFVEYQGRKITIAEAASELGIKRNVLYARYSKGDRGEELFRPVKTK